MANLKSFIARNNAAKVKELTSKPKADDNDKRRKVVIKAIDRTLEQIAKGETKPARGFYRMIDDENAIATVRAGRSQMAIEGHTQIALEKDQLRPFYEAVKEEVAAGNLDKEITEAYAKASKPKARK